MNLMPFLQGCLVGVSIAAPVGPIGVLCIRRALSGGWTVGLATGLGAAVADALYGTVAALGLGAISELLLQVSGWVGILGGLFLCFLGIRTWRSQPAETAATSAAGSDLGGAFFSTLLLTLANPATVLSFAALCAGFGIGTRIRGLEIPEWIAGVFAGSAAWWLFLSGSVASLRHAITPAWMRWINRLSGGLILGWGVVALARALRATAVSWLR
jgi:threonine/homoserine/homoserine lactone efflux protein